MAVSLVTVDCIGGLLTSYPTADSMVDMGGTSEPAWNKEEWRIPDDGCGEEISVVGERSDRRLAEYNVDKNDAGETH